MILNLSRRLSEPFAISPTEPGYLTAREPPVSHVVEDIVIPRHLISTASGSNRRSRRDSSGQRPAFWHNRILHQGNYGNSVEAVPTNSVRRTTTSRSNSITVGELYRSRARGYDAGTANTFAVEGRTGDKARKTSFPNLTESREAISPMEPAYAPDDAELIERYRNVVMFRSTRSFTFG